MKVLDYQPFIEDHFFIKNKYGEIVPFKFNDVQQAYYDELDSDYPNWQGIRENILKGRQFGLSSLITALFATDFIASECGEIPIIDSDVYSHKDEETSAHIDRFNLFLNSYLIRSQGGKLEDMDNFSAINQLRKAFLRIDNGGEIVSRKRGAQYHAQTASAKVSGRGGTKQNIHWSEVAFYPNTEIMNAKKLVVGAEKQVPQDHGKIFRETTGNLAGDYFAKEYQDGKDRVSQFRSRFIAWYTYKAYSKIPLDDWMPPEYYQKLLVEGLANKEQAYWHWLQTKGLEDKEELREYPTYDYEAFLYGGDPLFDQEALIYYTNQVQKPMRKALYVQAL